MAIEIPIIKVEQWLSDWDDIPTQSQPPLLS